MATFPARETEPRQPPVLEEQDSDLNGGRAFVAPFPPGGAPEGHDSKPSLYLMPSDVRRWSPPEDVGINIFVQYGWWNFVLPVASLNPESELLTLAKECSYALHPHFRDCLVVRGPDRDQLPRSPSLSWNNGHPVVPGINKVGPDRGEPFYTEGFDTAEIGKTPKGWGFNHKPNVEK